MVFAALLPTLLPIFGEALKRVLPDPAAQREAEGALAQALLARQGEHAIGGVGCWFSSK